MFKKNNKIAFALTFLAIAGVAATAVAKPNVNSRPDLGGMLKTTAGCRPAEGKVDLDINNVRARILTGGDMWWDSGTSEARYEVPKDSRKNSLFAGSVWIGGYDVQGQLKVAAQTYRQSGNDYWPGPLDGTGNIQASDCNDWDKLWKINKSVINDFKALPDKAAALNEDIYKVIKEWPAKGNQNAIGKSLNPLTIPADKDYAPFVDVDNNGIYSPATGDYPGLSLEDDLEGDQYIWWVFNDKGNVKGQSLTDGIGIEVQASAFAFSAKDFLNDATFYKYRLINRGNLTLDKTYISTWTDADLGYAYDDFIGCDTARGLGILYNGKSIDGAGEVNSYGDKIPMVGIDFFKGPRKTYRPAGATKDTTIELKMTNFTYYNNDNTPQIGNPDNGIQIYNYMTGKIKSGEKFTNDFTGPTPSKGYGSGLPTNAVFTGDPAVETEWSECVCRNTFGDRRFVHSSGEFKLEPGIVNDIVIGSVWVSDAGGCPNTSFKKIRAADDVAQALFNNSFKAVEGPQAPKLVVREMDRKLVFYLINEAQSDNYGERFGRDTAAKYRVNALSAKSVVVADSLYKFEGYRVFQLANRLVTPAQIFNDNGEVNTELAREVFQTDIKNGVSRIINYTKNTDISDTTWKPVVKVNGKDSGIRHSFEIAQDQFATTASGNSGLVNYRNYYFVAIAYAHNQFAEFNPRIPDQTQDVVYLESSKAAGGKPIDVVAAMPNPSNGEMGNVINANFGDGVIVKRLEGRGNGGNALELTKESEAEALASPNYRAVTPEYQAGAGPIGIKVVDPVKLKPHDWELFIEGELQDNDLADNSVKSRGMSIWSRWRLVNMTDGNTILSEQYLNVGNEQILEKYGISVNVQQVSRPGDDQVNGNGYISSFVSFADPAKPWLGGVIDAEDRDPQNWIRSGGKTDPDDTVCNADDNNLDTSGQFYERMLDNNPFTIATWAPYQFTNDELKNNCHTSLAYNLTLMSQNQFGLGALPSVDVVFTSDKSKWTRCVVVEMQNTTQLSENAGAKFEPRRHAGWNGDADANGRPIYSSNPEDNGMSWFPGYAINQETGERLNIMFGEDSWLKSDNGADMIWNPSSTASTTDEANIVTQVFGGKHVIYVLDTRYDEAVSVVKAMRGSATERRLLYRKTSYVGFPLINKGFQFTSIADGLIPTETRLKFRVTRPYAKYDPQAGGTLRNGGFPLYSFTTKGLAPTPLADNPNMDKQALLDRIAAVPNPYYGYSGYETNNLETKVRIINLPKRATVSVYSLDGALVARLEKDNANTSYIDWNIRNAKGLPVASGMYLMHVEAVGIGETVVRWFGAMRPINVTQY